MTEQSRSQTTYAIEVRPRHGNGEWYVDGVQDFRDEAATVLEARRLAEDGRVSTRVTRDTVVITREPLLEIAYEPRFTTTRLDGGEGPAA